jgi:photosystem II stability/assembly factor-like uncharacterized protein
VVKTKKVTAVSAILCLILAGYVSASGAKEDSPHTAGEGRVYGGSLDWNFEGNGEGWTLHNGFVDGGFMHLPPDAEASISSDEEFRTVSLVVETDGRGDIIISYGSSPSEVYDIEMTGGYTRLGYRAGGKKTRYIVDREPVLGTSPLMNLVIAVDGYSHILVANGRKIYEAQAEGEVAPRYLSVRSGGDLVTRIDSLRLTSHPQTEPTTVSDEEHERITDAEPGADGSSRVEIGGGVRGWGMSDLADHPAAGLDRNAVSPVTQNGWKRLGGPIGGLGYDIPYDYSNPDRWYVTDSNSGLHISDDNGKTWFPSNEGITTKLGPSLDVVPIFCATVDPIDPRIVWIGTENSGDIWKSTDRGQSWEFKSKGIPDELKPGISFRGFTVDPHDSDTVYAMAELGSEFCTDERRSFGGQKFDRTKGLVYRTVDGGESWEEIWRGDNLARICLIDPRNTDVLYISTGIFDREAWNSDPEKKIPGGVGIVTSTDGGKSWRELDEKNGLTDLYIGMLVMHPEDPDILLAAAGCNTYTVPHGDNPGGVYRTVDGGETWTTELSGEVFTVVEFAEKNPDIAYAASGASVYRSEDGGETWTRYPEGGGTWGTPGISPGVPIDLEADPRDPDRIFINNYLGGNFLSEDGGKTWRTASRGYSGADVEGVVVDREDPDRVYVAARSGIFRSDDAGETWKGCAYTSSGPGGIHSGDFNEAKAIALNPSDGNHLLVSPGIWGVARCTDGGRDWGFTATEGPVMRIEFAPSDPDIVYIALVGDYLPIAVKKGFEGNLHQKGDFPWAGVYVSSDGGGSFRPLKGKAMGESVIALAVSPRDAKVVIASRHSGEIIKTTDGGESWTDISIEDTPFPALSFAIEPGNPDRIYAGTAGGGVFKSVDGGETWNFAGVGLLPEAYINAVVVDPTDPDVVFAGDLSSGVYVSLDGGREWQPHAKGLMNRAITDLAISGDGKTLYAATFKGGMFRLDIR